MGCLSFLPVAETQACPALASQESKAAKLERRTEATNGKVDVVASHGNGWRV
jgi:hypothetical protein